MNEKTVIYQGITKLMADPDICEREFYSDFSQRWNRLFQYTLQDKNVYFNTEDVSVVTVPCAMLQDYGMDFHISQYKIHEWFRKELLGKKKVVFEPKRFFRRMNGEIHYDGVPCIYNTKAEEPALTEDMRNIVACAFPSSTPDLRIVFGNKWIRQKFNPFLTRRLSLYLIRTDYVPAFLADSFEVCVYLFLMDYCIIKEDCKKVKDKDLRNLLHIFRPSPMLRVKRLLP